MGERNLDLMTRKEGTREKSSTHIIKFELEEIKKHFTETVDAIRAQFPISDRLIQEHKEKEGENIWRAQIVFLESALDFYMHELTKFGLCEIYHDNWEHTEKYDNLKINMKYIDMALKSGEDIDWFLEYINDYYKSTTMVVFKSIKDQLNLLGLDIQSVANRAFYKRGEMEKTTEKLNRRLLELFERRNIIAHQSDRKHSNAQILDISKEIVEDFIEDTVAIVNAINEEAEKKSSMFL